MGRLKIEAEKIKDKQQRQICFSKRRTDLFRKAAKLVAMGCKIAIIVFFDHGNLFTFGHAAFDVDKLARRYLVELQPAHGEDYEHDDDDDDYYYYDSETTTDTASDVNDEECRSVEELQELETALAALRDMAKKRLEELLPFSLGSRKI